MRHLLLALLLLVGCADVATAQQRKLPGSRYFDTLTGTTITATTATATTATVAHQRFTNNASLTAADVNLTAAQIQAASVFPVSTTANAVDVDFGDDAALSASDVGSRKTFIVTAGGTNALTVTAGASGVTTVTTLNTLGTTCEDVGDVVECIVTSTTTATCVRTCAD